MPPKQNPTVLTRQAPVRSRRAASAAATSGLNWIMLCSPRPAVARRATCTPTRWSGWRGSRTPAWRDFFLAGPTELRDGSFGTPVATTSTTMLAQLSPEQIFDALAIEHQRAGGMVDVVALDVRSTTSPPNYG